MPVPPPTSRIRAPRLERRQGEGAERALEVEGRAVGGELQMRVGSAAVVHLDEELDEAAPFGLRGRRRD